MHEDSLEVAALLESWEEKSMSKATVSWPRLLMIGKLGSQAALDEALRNGEVIECSPPSGVKTPYFAFAEYRYLEKKGISKRQKIRAQQHLTKDEAASVEEAMSAVEIKLDFKKSEAKKAMTADTIKVLQECITSGNQNGGSSNKSGIGDEGRGLSQAHEKSDLANFRGPD